MIIEAMAAGVTVAATRSGGRPRSSATDAGLLLQPRRRICGSTNWTHCSPTLGCSGRWGSAANEGAERFGIERQVAAVLEVYADVLTTASKRP